MTTQVAATSFHLGDVELLISGEDGQYEPICSEVTGIYCFDEIEFRPGDFVLDVGAHVGITSMYLAKRYPGIRILAFEPVPENYKLLELHRSLNHLGDSVLAINKAVTADGRDLEMLRGSHTAEATGHYPTSPRARGDAFTVQSTTIPDILSDYDIKHVRLLKLDCEGAEHEILAASDGWMDRVDYVRGELHFHPWLAEQGYTLEATAAKVPAGKIGSAGWQTVTADYYH
jgi:FkbM family methyltransferase